MRREYFIIPHEGWWGHWRKRLQIDSPHNPKRGDPSQHHNEGTAYKEDGAARLSGLAGPGSQGWFTVRKSVRESQFINRTNESD